jgi:hemoglobin
MVPTPIRPGAPLFLVTVLILGLHVPLAAQEPAAEESLYDRLGGLEAIALVVHDFMEVFTQDPLIMANPAVRERKSPRATPYIAFQVTSLVCEATGGPCTYTGLELGPAHQGLNVSAAEWDRMAEIFAETLAAHQVPEREQEELFAILGPARDDIVVGEGGR